jgi:hypothetical protein
MRPLAAAGFAATFSLAACSDDDLSRLRDAAGNDAAQIEDAGADGGPADSGLDGGAPASCSQLEPGPDPTRPAVATGLIEIWDYDFWDEQRLVRDRVRNAGTNFLTRNIPVRPTGEGALFRSVGEDRCVVLDVMAPREMLGPPRNIGTELVMDDQQGLRLVRRRMSDQDGVHYRTFVSQMQLLQFFDPAIARLDHRWEYSTPGDPGAMIEPFTTSVGPVEDFEVTPALTSTGAPVVIDPAAFTVRWTAPATTAADLSITMGRALNMDGDARYLLCRPRDDGEFTVPEAAITEFGPVPGLAFDLSVERAQVAAFCNAGVPAGVAQHALVYLGAGVVR